SRDAHKECAKPMGVSTSLDTNGNLSRLLPALAAPPLDNALEDFRLAAGFAPQFREERIARRRPLFLFERVEIDADRDRDALAADDALAIAQRRDRIDEAARAFGHRRLHEMLVALVVETHRDDRAALRQHAFGEVRGALRDQAQRHAIFAALLGDAFEDLAHRLPAPDVL